MFKKVSFINKQNEKLAGILHTPKNPNKKGIILSHCFTCSKHHPVMKKLARILCKNNYTTLRFDFSGNGESQGDFEKSTYSKQTDDLSCAVDFLNKKVKTIGLIGHSMGSAISIFQANKDKRIKSICILGGQADTSKIKQYLSKQQLDEVYNKGKTKLTVFNRTLTVTKEFFEDADSQRLIDKVKTLIQPLSIIHGECDKVVLASNAIKINKFKKGKKDLHIIKGADHFFTKHFDHVQDLVLNWFNQTL